MNESAMLDETLLVTLDEAAKRLAISKRTLEREIVAGRFPRPLKIGRASRVHVASLGEYVLKLQAPSPV